MASRYPENWHQIATALKEKEQWRCYRCGIQCLSRRLPHSFRDSKRRIYLLQVHHWDGQPENNDPSNLVCLCTRCHLYVHRRHAVSVTPGQLRLFDLGPWHRTAPKALPIIESLVQLKIPLARTQLALEL
jgi:hypothetical protein